MYYTDDWQNRTPNRIERRRHTDLHAVRGISAARVRQTSVEHKSAAGQPHWSLVCRFADIAACVVRIFQFEWNVCGGSNWCTLYASTEAVYLNMDPCDYAGAGRFLSHTKCTELRLGSVRARAGDQGKEH